jgi:hypothetical protein
MINIRSEWNTTAVNNNDDDDLFNIHNYYTGTIGQASQLSADDCKESINIEKA